MKTLTRGMRLLAASGVIAAMLALTAGSAIADGPASWSNTSQGMKWSGSLTLYKDGGSAKTCTATPGGGSAYAGGSFWTYTTLASGHLWFSCTGGTSFRLYAAGIAEYEDANGYVIYGDAEPGGYQPSPYGNWYQEGFVGSFTNGAPSQVSFSNAYLGYTSTGAEMTATGSLNVTTNTGGVLTLSH